MQLFAKKLIPLMTIQVIFQNLLLRIHGVWIVPFRTYLKISKSALEKMLWCISILRQSLMSTMMKFKRTYDEESEVDLNEDYQDGDFSAESFDIQPAMTT